MNTWLFIFGLLPVDMKVRLIAFVTTLFFFSCNQINNKLENALPPKDSVVSTTTVITNDTIPENRTVVNPKAVASWTEHIPGDVNNGPFAVNIYETPLRFHFQLKMQYKTFLATDTIKIPNFGIEPVVSIQKGKEQLSCIIGFNDKKGEFKPYKQVGIKGDQLKVTTLNRYFAGVYSTPQK